MLLDVRGHHRCARGQEWLAENGRAQLVRLTDDVVALSHDGSAGDDQCGTSSGCPVHHPVEACARHVCRFLRDPWPAPERGGDRGGSPLRCGRVFLRRADLLLEDLLGGSDSPDATLGDVQGIGHPDVETARSGQTLLVPARLGRGESRSRLTHSAGPFVPLFLGLRELVPEPSSLTFGRGEHGGRGLGPGADVRQLGRDRIQLGELGGAGLVCRHELAQKREPAVGCHEGVTRYASKTLSMFRSEPRRVRSDRTSPISATYQFFAI